MTSPRLISLALKRSSLKRSLLVLFSVSTRSNSTKVYPYYSCILVESLIIKIGVDWFENSTDIMRPRLLLVLLLLIAVPAVTADPAPFVGELFHPTGQIPEAHCNVEDLEIANDSQLYSILQELKATNFFRNFVVDLDEKCPLSRNFGKTPTPAKEEEENVPDVSESEEEEEATCASAGLPDLDPDAEPACHVQDDPFGDSAFGQSASAFSSSSTTQATSTSTQSSSHPSTKEKDVAPEQPTAVDEPPPPPAEEGDDEFECTGGDDLDVDEEDEPLCTLNQDYTQPIRSLIAMALASIRSLGWESESQRKTYQWTKETNPVVTDMECDENGQLPDVFWQDMCSSISNGDSSKAINLVLNPERNTGYNGTHIWNAIYQENCLANEDLCYEERVLYRLLSGLHTSTTLSIAKHYYPPSKRKNRTSWEPNPGLFMTKFQHHPEHLRNLHFSYVVLLRALQKASTFLEHYEIKSGNIVEDEVAARLLKRLLDSDILESCQSVFSAFDERLMFRSTESLAVQQNFKGVFHNISSILDCVQCQQCKLHGKMAMLGYGAALKILFMKNSESYSLTRNEVVAFINTLAKFSESLKEVRELTNLYWQQETAAQVSSQVIPPSDLDLVDAAIGLIAALARQGKIDGYQEGQLVELAMGRDENLMLLFKHYGTNVDKFLSLSATLLSGDDATPDVIVIGSGLAGLAVALNILDRGGTVTIVEKEHLLGGNSNKASSGINAYSPPSDEDQDGEGQSGDFLESFRNDTLRSAGSAVQPDLVEILVSNSGDAVKWLKERAGVDLSLLAQLGGHSYKRTHRPSNGMAGAEIIYGVQKAVKAYLKEGKVKILVDTKVTSLITDVETGRVLGIEAVVKNGDHQKLYATNVVLATGGFAADRSSGSYLEKYRPELLNMPATAGEFSTGDGVTLAKTLGAGTIDMDKVQIHPTGWVDPKDPDNKSKVLAAELMRGVGGVLIDSDGKRFCNELGTRAYVTNRMLSHDAHFAATQEWDKSKPIPTFSLVLAADAAKDGQKHVDLYSHKGLLKRLEGLQALADWMGQDVEVLRETYTIYAEGAAAGEDSFGKVSFRGLPGKDLDTEVFYAGTVIPVLHYCMGGITIDVEGNVLNESGKMIEGLHAAGEVTGGVHGNNRLGGNSLLECTVFGTIVGKKLPIKQRLARAMASAEPATKQATKKEDRRITMDEVMEHNDTGDCWLVIHGVVYDLTEFAEEHPGGAESVHVSAGQDGSEAFAAVHNKDILDDFEEERIGILVQD
jgi:flavocytochrome c